MTNCLNISELSFLSKIADRILAPFVLCIIVLIFWACLIAPLKSKPPEYNYSEVEAISKVNLLTMWSWTDYKSYSRYSPTGLLLVGLLDRHFIAPRYQIDFSNVAQASESKRLLPLYFLTFILIALVTFKLTLILSGNLWAAFISGLYIGVNKCFFYFFYYTDCLALSLLLLYSLGLLIFWKKYLDSNRNRHLIGYYIFLFLCIGAWEQWMNLVGFIVLFSTFLLLKAKRRSWQFVLHGILIPVLVLSGYLYFRYSTMVNEVSSIKEAQYVFSYPATSMKIEDMVVNASYHISDTIDSILFPWPLLSQSLIHNYPMDSWNSFNKTYAPFPSMHYRFLTEWYAGFLMCFFLVITLLFILHLKKIPYPEYHGVMGIILIWTGFLVHLPVMYRAYFDIPGYLLGYKHVLSILGFSIFLGWVAKILSDKNKTIWLNNLFLITISFWIIYCNYWKIALSLNRLYPW